MRGPLAFLVALLVAGVLSLFLLPRSAKVSRSATVAASPSVVYALVVDLEQYQTWSPWKAADATLEVTYGSRRSGVGASYSWSGKDSGSGTLTVTEAAEPGRIVNDLDFDGAGATATWTFEPVDAGTKVTWTVVTEPAGPSSALFALMADKLIGPSLDDGLKRLGEQAAK